MSHIEDNWNVDGAGELANAWTGFTRFVVFNERPPEGFTWSGVRLTRKQTTSRLDNVWPDMWKHVSDAAKRRAKQKWAVEKPKLDDARQLRGIFFIEPEDEEFRHIVKNARRKLDVPMPTQCLVKHQQIAEGKPAAILGKTSPNMLVLSNLSSPREFDWKELLLGIMRIMLQRKE